jgi:RES domain-containing protein
VGIVAYRVTKQKYIPFDGRGALYRGGRWNSPGREVIYCSRTYANALLEILARANIRRLPGAHHCVVVEAPDTLAAEEVDSASLPGWDAPDQKVSRAFGDRWLTDARTAVLLVPSLVARPFEQNVLVNPRHPAAASVSVSQPVSVVWDLRLFRLW